MVDKENKRNLFYLDLRRERERDTERERIIKKNEPKRSQCRVTIITFKKLFIEPIKKYVNTRELYKKK